MMMRFVCRGDGEAREARLARRLIAPESDCDLFSQIEHLFDLCLTVSTLQLDHVQHAVCMLYGSVRVSV